LRFTRRGSAGAAAGAGVGSTGAGSGSGSLSFDGEREERRSGAWGFGISRRVISPCPTVQRFVVTQ
jgi:hypothetical protein